MTNPKKDIVISNQITCCNAKWTMLLAWWGNVDKAWSLHKKGES